MVTTNKFVPASTWKLVLVIICGMLCGACGYGMFSPEARQQAKKSDQYLKVLRSLMVKSNTFEWKFLSSSIIVQALPYNHALQKVAEHRFYGSATFTEETSAWLKPYRSFPAQPTVILMGLYTQDLAEDDVTKTKRFRPRLLSSDGRTLEPLEIKRYGRDNPFIRDHFPIFNPWEEVFMVKFAEDRTTTPLTYQLCWPGGVQTLTLK